jgi:iron(III) transport system substrate-binding protein
MEEGSMGRGGKRALAAGAACVLAAAAVVGGLSSSARGAASAGSITLYSAQHEGMTKALVAAFEKRTGIDVRVRFGEDEELANQIVAEGSSSPADVILTENSPPLVLLEEKRLLAQVAASAYARVPQRYSSPGRAWVGVAGRATALVYDPKLLPASMLPASILDLAKPAWKGKLAIAPSEADFQPVVAAVIELKGLARARTWLQGFKANAKVYNDNEGIVAAVERGQVAAAIIDHYYWFRASGGRSMTSRLHYIGHRDPGALIDVSGVGALASSKHAALAQRFLAFAVSRAGQRTLVTSGDFEYPLAAGVPAAPQLRPLAKLAPPRISIAQLGDGTAALRLLQAVGLL